MIFCFTIRFRLWYPFYFFWTINFHAQKEWRMKKKDLEFFKELLNNRLQELLNQAGNTVSGMTEQKEKFSGPH